MSDAGKVNVRVEAGIAFLTLANPRRKNAITLAMTEQIAEFSARVESDPSIGVVIIDAEGGYFCSGADTRDLAASSDAPASTEALERTSAVYGAFVRIGNLPVPTIALIEGGAVGAGMNLALAADVVLVTPDAILDSGFLARRIHPGGGHLRLLGRSLGYQQAIAMAALGAALTGEQAVGLGLAWRALPADELLPTAIDMGQLAASDPLLVRKIKASARLELEDPGLSWPAAVEVERGMQMWSLGRKQSQGWDERPAAPKIEAGK
jgi:enoyl-CoA hydratase